MKLPLLSLVLAILVSTSYGRSLTPNDVPDPPKKVMGRLSPIAALPHVQARISVQDQGKLKVPSLIPAKVKGVQPLPPRVPHQPNAKTQHHDTANKPRSKGQHLPLVKTPSNRAPKHPAFKVPLHTLGKGTNPNPVSSTHPKGQLKVPAYHQINRKGQIPPHAIPKGTLIFERPAVNDGNGTTLAPPPVTGISTTTLDPWEEFCKEACEAGMAGPECDCAGHPIGRRHAPLLYLRDNEEGTNLQ